jgi:hypothetical protein
VVDRYVYGVRSGEGDRENGVRRGGRYLRPGRALGVSGCAPQTEPGSKALCAHAPGAVDGTQVLASAGGGAIKPHLSDFASWDEWLPGLAYNARVSPLHKPLVPSDICSVRPAKWSKRPLPT